MPAAAEPKYPPSDVIKPIKTRIRAAVQQRRLRLEDFFQTFDRMRTKKVLRSQFQRALDDAGLELDQLEIELLAQRYRVPNAPDMVNYRKFCDQIEKVFTIKNLETKPTARVVTSLEAVTLKTVGEHLTELEMAEVEVALEKVRRQVKLRGLIVKNYFRDFDPSNSSSVPQTLFVRTVLNFAQLSEREAVLLARNYRSNPNYVNYRHFHNGVTPLDVYAGNEAMPVVRRMSGSVAADDVSKVEELLLCEVSRSRIRVDEFFRDCDQLHTGMCTTAQFRAGVCRAFRHVTEAQLRALVNKYRHSGDRVRYQGFCNNMMEAFATSGLERNPLKSVDTEARRLATQPLRVLHPLDPEEQKHFDIATEVIRRQTTNKRIYLKSSFQDFDRRHEGYTSQSQFLRVLSLYRLVPEDPRAVDAIFKRYLVRSARCPGDFVNYIEFCQDMDPPERGHAEKPAEAPLLEHKQAEVERIAVPHMLKLIKDRCKRDRIRIEEFFADKDKLRHGKIAQAAFSRGLDQAGFVFQPEDVRRLAEAYGAGPQDTDNDGSELVLWTRFTADVNAIFATAGLERAPTINLAAAEAEAEGEEFDEARLTPAEENRLKFIMQHIKDVAGRQRLELLPAFETFDHANRGYVPRASVERALASLRVLPSPDDLELIASKFRETLAPGNTMGVNVDVNYRALISAMEQLGQEGPLSGTASFRTNIRKQAALASTEPARRADLTGTAGGVPAIIHKMQQQMLAKRIRVQPFFQEGDPLRAGELTVAKFRSAIGRAGLLLTHAELSRLEEEFRSDSHHDMIGWRLLCHKLEGVARLEGDPLKRPTSGIRREIDSCEDQVDQDALQAALDKVRAIVFQRRLHLMPYFCDYDRSKSWSVAPVQFEAVLDKMTVRIPASDIALLKNAFKIRGGEGFNYRRFVQQVNG